VEPPESSLLVFIPFTEVYFSNHSTIPGGLAVHLSDREKKSLTVFYSIFYLLLGLAGDQL
jgi:hypothetical protein